MSKTIPMIGKRFGRLTVIAEGEKSATSRSARWICRCDCGNITKPITGEVLRKGKATSCGCYKRELTIERSTRHGLCGTRIHRIWSGMKSRCYNPNAPKYSRYGARGIRVCDEWLNSLEAFCEWAMTHGYADNLTIDRIDNDGNYCPENCRWTTNEDQCNNRGHHILLEINGETKTIAQWAKSTEIAYRTIHARHHRGWTGENLIRKAGLLSNMDENLPSGSAR